MNRERAVTDAFVSIAANLAAGGDVVDLLGGLARDTARLLDVASTGILLADPHGILHVVAASSEAARGVEVFQLQREQGPCLDCFRSGTPVTVPDLRSATARWPEFGPAAVAAGFRSVHALPIRLRDAVLGTLGLFGTTAGTLGPDDLRLGQSLAYVAAVALMQEPDSPAIPARLRRALDSRVALEQAKGVLAQCGDLDMDEAFATLRRYARDHDLPLTEVADAVVARRLDPDELIDGPATGRSAPAAGPPPPRSR